MSEQATVRGLLRPYVQKFLPYVIAAIAGVAGYGGGQQQLIEKCVAGVTAEAPAK